MPAISWGWIPAEAIALWQEACSACHQCSGFCSAQPERVRPAAEEREARAAMLAGVLDVAEDRRAEVLEVGDRRAAIEAAVALARPGDTVLVAGKGHETGQEIAGTVHPFDDRVVVRELLADPRVEQEGAR